MVKRAATVRYEPGPTFEEVKEEAMFDIPPTGSEELWLIQWPKGKLSVSDFHGKELSLKLHNDGNLGTIESSSGKSYDLVSFASQQPDATVFLPSESKMKAVGKISRRVSLVHYPEPEEFEKASVESLAQSSKKSAGSYKKTVSRFTAMLSRSRFTGVSKDHSSQGSALSLGAMSVGPTPKHKKREDENCLGHSNVPGKASEGSRARGAESNAATGMPQTTPEKSPKKLKVAE